MDYMDFHADTLTEISRGDLLRNPGEVDLERVSRLNGKYAQVFALWKDRRVIRDPEREFMEAYRKAVGLIRDSKRMELCSSCADMEAAFASGRQAAFLSVEDCSFMGSHIRDIRELGIRFAILTWNYENEYGCGSVTDQKKGLTDRGRELIRFLNEKEVLVDVSHLSDKGVEEVFLISDAPVLASHSNTRAVREIPRNLTDSQIREIIRRGGVIGMNLYRPFVGEGENVPLSCLFRHMDHILELGGEDALVWGGDFDGSCGEFPEGVEGVQSMGHLYQEMEKAGFSAELIAKIFFRNGQAFLQRNLR